jgi:hypothetical protein
MRQFFAPDPRLALARAFPPVPHPSWFAASQPQPERRLSADEFWNRLGL